MWIRSQDKTKLINCEYIMVHQTTDSSYNILGNNVPMGNYSTKEKALEIIDKLSRKIYETSIYNMEDGDFGGKHFIPLEQVYQMPQDKETKEND